MMLITIVSCSDNYKSDDYSDDDNNDDDGDDDFYHLLLSNKFIYIHIYHFNSYEPERGANIAGG